MTGFDGAAGAGAAPEPTAPVIPLFSRDRPGSAPHEHNGGESAAAAAWHATWAEDEQPPDDSAQAVHAEQDLLGRLRRRSLSVREARRVLAGHDLDQAQVDGVIERAIRNGYLDDRQLAEQLVHTAVERRGKGRVVAAQELSARGVPRDVVDEVLTTLPDDEAERALEFARTRISRLTGLDRDVALRRLAGQLARRGYAAHALSAARQALDEAKTPVLRVRFE
ncbi:regulatory protein RecX [Microbacterium sp.]|uniref:regulatory protein RecX n=1 Tax=Microbacterium sp. TaxID=51671 RepID=UPI003A898DB9